MANSEVEIKEQIKRHIDSEGSSYSQWYVGISKDGKDRLKQHSVDLSEGKTWWIIRIAITADQARSVEKYFLNLGCDGSGGGGDDTSDNVYAYKKYSGTNP